MKIRPVIFALIVLALSAGVAGFLFGQIGSNQESEARTEKSSTALRQTYEVHIRQPQGPPAIETGNLDLSGMDESVSCATCHSTREPEVPARFAYELDLFHRGLTFNHGELSCQSCHDPNAEEQLRLADGRHVDWPDVKEQCAQCHGPQARDYDNGSHGGMMGYWDLERGGRVRNNCIDCHDPHDPEFRPMNPVPPPRDRFISALGNGHQDSESHGENADDHWTRGKEC